MKKTDKKTPWNVITRAMAFAIFRPKVSIATRMTSLYEKIDGRA
jgi:hypothetical protein